MKKHQILLVFAILFGILNLATGQCPRDETAALAEDPTRSCRKDCTVTADCAGVKTCNCDDHCGMSCFNPDAECPNITVINGNIAFSKEHKYGSEATLTCNQGYALAGQRIRTCRSNKEWSHSNDIPNCTQGCLTPSSLGKAFVSSGDDYYAVGYPVGHVVTYECRTGYDAAGNGDRTCQSDFSWTSLTMTCTIRACKIPPTVDHASHTGTNYNFGGSITYSCDTGYNMDGRASFNCYAEGEWSPKDSWPTCEPVRCIPPQSPDNGGYTGGTTQTYGDIVDYNCHPGYKLNGTDEGRCNENGMWGDAPTCDASVDATFNDANLDGYTVVSGSWARKYETNSEGLPGYSLSGDGTVRSVLYPLTGDQKVCMQAYIKNTKANELKAQAYQGGEMKDLHTFSASDAWKLEKFWLTPVKSADTQVQLQFVATDGSNVLLDEIKEMSDSECGDVVPDMSTATSSTSTSTSAPISTSAPTTTTAPATSGPTTTTATTTKPGTDSPGTFPGWAIAVIVIVVIMVIVGSIGGVIIIMKVLHPR